MSHYIAKKWILAEIREAKSQGYTISFEHARDIILCDIEAAEAVKQNEIDFVDSCKADLAKRLKDDYDSGEIDREEYDRCIDYTF
jgi:hypothetical protein